MVIDNVEFYEEKLLPQIQTIMRMCNEKNIPVFMAFGIKLNDDGKIEIADCKNVTSSVKKKGKNSEDPMSAYAIIPQVLELQSKDERFAEFVNVVNGFHTVVNRNEEEFDMSDITPPDI